MHWLAENYNDMLAPSVKSTAKLFRHYIVFGPYTAEVKITKNIISKENVPVAILYIV